jgi:hypothetical protein
MIIRDIPMKEHAASVEDKTRPGLEHGVNLVKVLKRPEPSPLQHMA